MVTENIFEAGHLPLDRNGADALWIQLEHELRRRMELGHFAERFPTDRELMETYGVSRHTARHAVNQLGADGIVRRARGIGTSVDRRTMERSLGSLYSLFQVVEESGITQHSVVRRLEVVTDATAAEHLGVDADTELVLIDRVRLAGNAPIAIDQIWIPAELGRPLLRSDFSHTSFYNELERTIGRRPNEGWERIRPAVPTLDQRETLEIDDGEAVFAIERLGECRDMAIEWRVTIIRGDRFSFVADWTTGQRNELRIQLSEP
jgi:GntR family transcriptional regulator